MTIESTNVDIKASHDGFYNDVIWRIPQQTPLSGFIELL